MTLQDNFDIFVAWATGRLTKYPLTRGDLETLRAAHKSVKDERIKILIGTYFSGAQILDTMTGDDPGALDVSHVVREDDPVVVED